MIKKYVVLLIIALTNIIPNESICKTITILSIDGGGIRGIIPVVVLKKLQERLNAVSGKDLPIHKYFDIIAGTSSGGITSLLLTATEDGKTNKFTIDDIQKFYLTLGRDVFNRSLWRKIKSCSGWLADKYDPKAMEDLLQVYFGKIKLNKLLANVLIPAYDIDLQKMKFFSSKSARDDVYYDYFIKDIARATSAAPTYFPPKLIYNVDGSDSNILVDGGVGANNPTLCAAVHAIDLYGKNISILIVSIGTGNISSSHNGVLSGVKVNLNDMGVIDWSPLLVNTFMESSNDIVDYQLKRVLRTNYHRLQIYIEPEYSKLDEATEENIKQLIGYAEELIESESENIEKIVNDLVTEKKARGMSRDEITSLK